MRQDFITPESYHSSSHFIFVGDSQVNSENMTLHYRVLGLCACSILPDEAALCCDKGELGSHFLPENNTFLCCNPLPEPLLRLWKEINSVFFFLLCCFLMSN